MKGETPEKFLRDFRAIRATMNQMHRAITAPVKRLARLLSEVLWSRQVLSLWLWFTRSLEARRRHGTITFPFVARQINPRALILIYHRVNDDHHPYFPGTTVKDFEAQMQVLRRHFNVLPLEELIISARECRLPPNPVAITFDDGYRDNFDHAFPILSRLDLPATIFLVTGVLEKNGLIWHDRFFEMFRRTEVSSLDYDGRRMMLASPSEKKEGFERILGELRNCSPEERDSRINNLERKLGVRTESDHSVDKLTWSQIKTMAEGTITFGAHTVTHPILSRVSTDIAQREITESKRTIEGGLGKPVRLFAYPSGRRMDFTDSTKELVAGAGFLGAVTTIFGAIDKSQDLFELRRVSMWGDNHRLAAARLAWTRLTLSQQ